MASVSAQAAASQAPTRSASPAPQAESVQLRQLHKHPLKKLTGLQVLATGSYAPEEVGRNEDLAALGYDADWIVQRTGILERRRVAPHQATSDMAVAAREKLPGTGEGQAERCRPGDRRYDDRRQPGPGHRLPNRRATRHSRSGDGCQRRLRRVLLRHVHRHAVRESRLGAASAGDRRRHHVANLQSRRQEDLPAVRRRRGRRADGGRATAIRECCPTRWGPTAPGRNCCEYPAADRASRTRPRRSPRSGSSSRWTADRVPMGRQLAPRDDRLRLGRRPADDGRRRPGRRAPGQCAGSSTRR